MSEPSDVTPGGPIAGELWRLDKSEPGEIAARSTFRITSVYGESVGVYWVDLDRPGTWELLSMLERCSRVDARLPVSVTECYYCAARAASGSGPCTIHAPNTATPVVSATPAADAPTEEFDRWCTNDGMNWVRCGNLNCVHRHTRRNCGGPPRDLMIQSCSYAECDNPPPYGQGTHGLACFMHHVSEERDIADHQRRIDGGKPRPTLFPEAPTRSPWQSHALGAGLGVWNIRGGR